MNQFASIDTVYRLSYSIFVQWRTYLMVTGLDLFNIIDKDMVS